MSLRGRIGGGDDRGAVLPIVALAMGVLVIMTAFSVDLGRQMLRRRDMQAVADVVALDLSRLLDGNTAAYFNSGAGHSAFESEKLASADRNHASSIPVLDAVAGQFDNTNGWRVVDADPATAVKVTAGDNVTYYFAPGSSSVTRQAIASRPESALGSYSVGSFLASMTPNANTVLGGILGSIIPGANVLSYDGLVNTRVTVEQLGLNIPAGAVTPNEMANVQITMYDLLTASIAAVQTDCGCSSNAAITILQTLQASTSTSGPTFNLGDALGLNFDGGDPAGTVTVDLLQVLTTSAFLADGDHAISIPTFSLGIPQIGAVDLTLTAIEGPRYAPLGPDDNRLTTRQFSLQVTPHITVSTADITKNVCSLPLPEQTLLNSLLGGLLNLLTCTLGGSLNEIVTLNVDASPTLNATAAEVTATQTSDCATPALILHTSPVAVSVDSAVHVDVSATVAGTSIGNLLQADMTAGVKTTGSAADVTFLPTDTGPDYLAFNPPSAQVGSVPLGLAGALSFSATDVTVANLNLSTLADSLVSYVSPLINSALQLLDQNLVTPLAQMLGVSLGGAQLWPWELNCTEGGPTLVK